MDKVPRIGVSVVLQRGKTLLIGLRKGSHGAGCWGFPGGHLEFSETFQDCAARELLEETNIHVQPKDFHFIAATSDFFEKEDKHYVTIFLGALAPDKDPVLMEPHKCESWEWVHADEVLFATTHRQLFLPIRNLKEQHFSAIAGYVMNNIKE